MLPFTAFFTLGLRSFYINGAWYGDAGILASIMWHAGWELRMPEVLGRGSFLAIHMVPLFWLTSGLSWFLPFSRVQFFALFLGAVQALMALSVYSLLIALGLRRSGAVALAVIFSCNGIVLAASCDPHFELLIVAAGVAFLSALAQGRIWLARCFFLLCLITREDAGGHLALLLMAGAMGLRWQGVEWPRLRVLLVYAGVALGWSIASITAQHVIFSGAAEALRVVYLGNPVFAGITPRLLSTRLLFYCFYRIYLVLPAMIALILADRWRAPSLMAGFVSCLPWLGLNWLAVGPYAGTLSDYYPFTEVFGLFWPLAAQRFAEQCDAARPLSRRRAVGAFSALLASSFVGLWGLQNPQSLRFPGDFFGIPSLKSQQATENAMLTFRTAPLGRVAADGAVIALDPNHFKEEQVVWRCQTIRPDTVIFFAKGQGTLSAMTLADQAGLKYFYQVPGTALRLASDRALDMRALNFSLWVPTAFP